MSKKFFLLSCLFLGVCLSLLLVVKPISAGKTGEDSKDQQIFIVDHGQHTSLVVPSQELTKMIPDLAVRFPNVTFLEFGWGDRDFYRANTTTIRLILQAIFLPTESVIHVAGLVQSPFSYFSESQSFSLCITDSEFSSLKKFILNSFYKNKQVVTENSVVYDSQGLYGNGQFYKGVGKYYLMNTCNNWVAKGLQSAGYDINPAFKLTAGSIVSYLSNLEQVSTQSSHICGS